ncbi:zinc finger protein CONSTANS-LIKE 1-like [Andrographis paniculata]|uniref:zinc finger protein CONSTANS-LIKE 1-like n=1 Tax=Andrographis paniculata TaxID=175694 RepID=UPI0021E7D349|nr:zinc finger protein CONSTANS-LIKE 1-like [Andrographis paniculata]
MSSDLFVYENAFFSDPISLFGESHHPQFPLEILDEDSSNLVQENPTTSIEETGNCLDQIASAWLSSSPPSVQLENLSLQSQFGNAAAFSVKSEDFPLSFDSGFHGILPQSFDGAAVRYMQRSFSSNSFENKQSFPFQPQFDNLIWECQNLPDSYAAAGHMRRVCSTGDLQKVKGDVQARNVVSVSGEKSLMEEGSFKVGKYSAEERKERIDRYRAKRTQRNFNKTIKYACRKTLADNRPRIRGRFARNDEAGEIPNSKASSRSYEDEDDLWIDGFHEEEEEEEEATARIRSWSFFNGGAAAAAAACRSSTHYQNYSY